MTDKFRELYKAANALVIKIGSEGYIDAVDELTQALMDALWEIDESELLKEE